MKTPDSDYFALHHYNPPPKTSLPRTTKIKAALLGAQNAGKTSIIRRYFDCTFDSRRAPTLGSDFFSRKVPLKKKSSSDSAELTKDDIISFQVWDTPGRERFAANRKIKFTAAFPDSFFKSLDVCILIYDASSSTSFSHVLKWHHDLLKRIKRLEETGERCRPLPVLIAGNKIDIMKQRVTQKSLPHPNPNLRDVMGLTGKDFRGKDSRYEYTANSQRSSSRQMMSSSSSGSTMNSKVSSPSSGRKQNKNNRSRFEISTYGIIGTGDQISFLEQNYFNNDVRGSYLESLLSTEDGSHPDKDMVLLWCYRNGLNHHEVSALDGTGIEELMNATMQLALDSEEQGDTKVGKIQPLNDIGKPALFKMNEELDLHKSYAPKKSCLFPFFHWCCEELKKG